MGCDSKSPALVLNAHGKADALFWQVLRQGLIEEFKANVCHAHVLTLRKQISSYADWKREKR
jgi:hypothetical protein